MTTNKNGILRERDTIRNPSMDSANYAASRAYDKKKKPKPYNKPQDLLIGYKAIAQKVASFMYKNPQKPETKCTKNLEEYEDFLVQLMKMAWENHERGLRELRNR